MRAGAVRPRQARRRGAQLFLRHRHRRLFRRRRRALADPAEAGKFYVRLVQKLVGLLEAGPGGGFVFRVDLRLQARSVLDAGRASASTAALQYYESRGQNWERAAWIKARVAAGDQAASATAFLAELAPFVWRKHLDYATIADVQAMKRQIDIARRIGDEEVAGHNVKLGRGGIREIEFFAQTQQLIAGGRNRDLRVRPTAEALRRLAANGWIAEETADELIEAYWYLRAVENRLQMRRNDQTHTMPESAEDCAVIAAMMGEDEPCRFRDATTARPPPRVRERYAELFTEAKSLSGRGRQSRFHRQRGRSGHAQDPGRNGLCRSGQPSPPRSANGMPAAMPRRAPSEARAKLTALLPPLLKTFSEARQCRCGAGRGSTLSWRGCRPACSCSRCCRRMSICRRLLVDFMASAPRLAEAVIHRAHVLDGLIDPAFPSEINRRAALVGKVDGFLADARELRGPDRPHPPDRPGAEIPHLGRSAVRHRRGGQCRPPVHRAGRNAAAPAVRRRARRSSRCSFGEVPGARIALLAFGKMASARNDRDLRSRFHPAVFGAARMSSSPTARSRSRPRIISPA